MKPITVGGRTAPSPASYGKKLESLLIDEKLDKELAQSIAEHVEHGSSNFPALVERLQEHGLTVKQFDAIATFIDGMSVVAALWNPTEEDRNNRSVDKYQQMREVYPGLDNARWRLDTLLAGYAL